MLALLEFLFPGPHLSVGSCLCQLLNITLFCFCAVKETISSALLQLEEDDIEDFYSLAQYYASRTPQSFRKVS